MRVDSGHWLDYDPIALIVLVIGIVWYVIKAFQNRRAGVETDLMYKMLPPD